ncbi:MAG: hypothetical protein WKF36_01335 [Candidatus Nitrosocosmicus sp.]
MPSPSQSVLIAGSSVGLISNVIAEDAHAPLKLNFIWSEAVNCAKEFFN